MKEKVFANIPNFVLSVQTGSETARGKNEFTNKGSMLDITHDDRIIKICYELLVGTNFREICKTSTNDLIEMCKYTVNKYNQKSFRELLLLLQDKSYIEIDKNDFSPKDIIAIDTENLLVNKGFTTITQVEMDMIDNITTDNRERNTLLKCYFFIKCMVHKREDNTMRGLQALQLGEQVQTIAMDYKYINKFTNISDINKFIKLLKEHKLIDYDNFHKFPIGQPELKKDAKNVYVICEREDNFNEELIKEELRVGINQYKDQMQKDGWVVCKEKEYKNNDKKLNGTKGKVKQMQNEGKDTMELEQKVEKLIETRQPKVEPIVPQEEPKVEPIIEPPKEPRIVKTKLSGTRNIVKKPEPVRPSDAIDAWDYMFSEDTYKMDVPKNEVPKMDVPEVEYDDRGNVLIESVLSEKELDAYYKEQFERNSYWGEESRNVNF